MFRLSPASTEALAILCAEKRQPIHPIPEAEEAAEAAPMEAPTGELQPQSLQFNDRSFMRTGLSAAINRFMTAIEEIYRSKGHPFVDPGGFVHFDNKKSVKWALLVQQIPGFFQLEFQNAQGHRFSRQVHAKLGQLVPTGISSDFLNPLNP